MSAPKHAPLPWSATIDRNQYGEWTDIFGADGSLVGNMPSAEAPYGGGVTESERANAEFIVRAVNAHNELVAALKRVRACDRCGEDYGRCLDCDRALDAALKKAGAL